MTNTNNNCCETVKPVDCHRNNSGVSFVILIVLYILLAIILGSYWY